MRGAHYVATALLVTASSRIAAELNETKPLQTPDNDFVVSRGRVDETWPLQESRSPQDASMLHEERTPSVSGNSQGNLKRSFIETVDYIKKEINDVFAKATKPTIDQENLIPQSEASTSKRQRINPTPIDEQALPALPKPGNYMVELAEDVPSVLAGRWKSEAPKAIISNAARTLLWHDFRPNPSGPSTSGFPPPDVRLNIDEIAEALVDSKRFKSPYRVRRQSEAHFLNLIKGNAKFAHPATVHGKSIFTDWTSPTTEGLHVFENFPVSEKVFGMHRAFLKAFNLPFHQYIQETAEMMKLVEHMDSSPSNYRIVNAFKKVAEKRNNVILTRLVDPDLKKLLGSGYLTLEDSMENMRDAYIVKLVIMYELFYEFCHILKGPYQELPHKGDSKNWIFKLTTLKSGSSKDQISLSHG